MSHSNNRLNSRAEGVRVHVQWVKRVGRAAAVAVALAFPSVASAQLVAACDFDIADDMGRFTYGNTVHLTGRPGSSSNVGEFVLFNSNSAEQDVDKDGYAAAACDYFNIYIAVKANLVNVANPALAIDGDNIIVARLSTRLRHGRTAVQQLSVEVPAGTVAGTYIGHIEIRDSVILPAINPNSEFWNIDRVAVEITVVEEAGVSLLEADSEEEVDSVVVRGRAGQRASGVFRIANAGNTPLQDVRLSATDLRSESAIGLVIPASAIEFSPPNFAALSVVDTQRVTVTVDIPRGILGGRYRGAIIVQGQGVTTQQIPLIVIVTSSRGILFANNPVRGSLGDVGQIAFNGDPGTPYQIGIYDMAGLLVWTDRGTVFAGSTGGTPGTPENPGAGADFAVNYLWPLRNGRGEEVASGMYLVVVESTVAGQRQLAKDRLMVIR